MKTLGYKVIGVVALLVVLVGIGSNTVHTISSKPTGKTGIVKCVVSPLLEEQEGAIDLFLILDTNEEEDS